MRDSRPFQTAQNAHAESHKRLMKAWNEHLNERSRKTKKQTTRQKKESAHAHTF